jgi:hypothetical protein
MRKLGATSSIEAARQLHVLERSGAPESVTGYPFGVEFPHNQSSLSPSHQGGSGNDHVEDHTANRVRDGAFGERWGANALPLVDRAPRFRWPLPARGRTAMT